MMRTLLILLLFSSVCFGDEPEIINYPKIDKSMMMNFKMLSFDKNGNQTAEITIDTEHRKILLDGKETHSFKDLSKALLAIGDTYVQSNSVR